MIYFESYNIDLIKKDKINKIVFNLEYIFKNIINYFIYLESLYVNCNE